MSDNAPLHKGQKPGEGISQSLRDLLPFASQFPAEEAGILWALYQLESDLKSYTSADPEMDADLKQRWLAAEGDFIRFMEGLVSDPSVRGKAAAAVISLFQLFSTHLLGLVVRLTLRLRPDHMRLRNPESDLLLIMRLTRLGILLAACVVKFNQFAGVGKAAPGETRAVGEKAPYQFGTSWGPSVMRAILEAAREISYRMSEHSPLADARRKLTETVRAYVSTRPEFGPLVQYLICPPVRWVQTCQEIAGLLPTTEQARQALALWGMEFDRQACATCVEARAYALQIARIKASRDDRAKGPGFYEAPQLIQLRAVFVVRETSGSNTAGHGATVEGRHYTHEPHPENQGQPGLARLLVVEPASCNA